MKRLLPQTTHSRAAHLEGNQLPAPLVHHASDASDVSAAQDGIDCHQRIVKVSYHVRCVAQNVQILHLLIVFHLVRDGVGCSAKDGELLAISGRGAITEIMPVNAAHASRYHKVYSVCLLFFQRGDQGVLHFLPRNRLRIFCCEPNNFCQTFGKGHLADARENSLVHQRRLRPNAPQKTTTSQTKREKALTFVIFVCFYPSP